MRDAPKAVVLQNIGTLFQFGTTGEWSDGDLLNRFIARQDQDRSAAFEALVERHGPMVLDVCRNVLRNEDEAEDAFQATFLILARQARSIRKRGSVGSWLFGVATRVATRSRIDAARRRARERAFAKDVSARPPMNHDNAEKTVLHEEIARLPEKYRELVVLCYLEGMSYLAAAERLGCPVGTVSVRLMRARERLRSRLVRRGEASFSSSEVLGGAMGLQPVDPALLASVIDKVAVRIPGGMLGTGQRISAINSLVQGVTTTMVARQLTSNAVGAAIVGTLLVGTAVLAYQPLGRGTSPTTIVTQSSSAGPEPTKALAEDAGLTALHWVDSMQKLGRIGIAINAFDEANGFLPPNAIRDPNTGKPLLSWRVAILPWIGSKELYQQFHLDEAWDSPHNKALIAKMPFEYAPVGVKTEDPFATYYQVFVGPGTAFETRANNNKLKLTGIRDGAANTLAVVEAGSAVPWTKPEDLQFLPDRPLPPLGGLFRAGFNLVFLDASVWSVARKVDERLLKALITRDGGEPINRDQLNQIPLVQGGDKGPIIPRAQRGEVLPRKGAAAPAQDQPGFAQLRVAKQALKAIDEMNKLGNQVSDEEFHKWSLRLMELERAFSTNKAEEIAAFEAHCKRMKELSERAEKLYKNGQKDILRYLEASYWYEEAVAWLQDVKEVAAKASRQ
jgi:RNA polymerase sigma factor (sigma-70 family)